MTTIYILVCLTWPLLTLQRYVLATLCKTHNWCSFYIYGKSQFMWVTQSCPTLCSPMDYSSPGSSVHGILQTMGAVSYSLPQGIFPTQGLNPGFPHCRKIFFFFLPYEPIGKAINSRGMTFRSFAKGLVIALSFLDSVNYLCTLKTISPKECHPWTSVTEKCHLSRCCRKDQMTL